MIHGIVINRKLKTWYNPGLVAEMIGHVPTGIWYLIEIAGRHVARFWRSSTWLFFMGAIMQWIGFRVLADVNSPYPFTPEEMSRNNPSGQLRRAGINPRP